MKNKPFLLAACVLGLVLVLWLWRRAHPQLTDSEQIAANLNGIVTSANNRSAGAVASYLSPKFTSNGLKKSEFQNQLVGGILQYRVIDLKTSAPHIEITGDTAISEGTFTLNLKSEYTSPPETTKGQFRLEWQREDGQWKVRGATGIPQMGGGFG